MTTSTIPDSVARVKGDHIIVQELGDELVIFDRRTNKAHLLDTRATAVFRAAEDGCSLDDVVGVITTGTPAQRQATARLAISDLERAGVLVSEVKAVSRRGLLKTMGSVAALPMVISILAPRPAAAASCAVACAPAEFCLLIHVTAVPTTCNSGTPKEPLCCLGATATRGLNCECTINDQCCSSNCSAGFCAA